MNMYRSELPLDIKVAALADIAEGIEYLHNNHGSIKPSNVLLMKTVILCSKSLIMLVQRLHGHIQPQFMTPGYIAPELIPSDDSDLCVSPPPPNKATDIYAFAIMACEVVFTKEAWPNVSMTLMTRVKHEVRPEIPAKSNDTLSNLIRECWLQDSEL